jgi:SHS family lactate transporter-like MFS transporter
VPFDPIAWGGNPECRQPWDAAHLCHGGRNLLNRKIPLMISILWYSICNFIAGFSPTFAFLFFFRALLGIGMGAEWPAGASLAMESWPARSRGLMSSVLQGSWALGFLASSAAYGLLFDAIGWRGLLWIGILPALVVVWVRKYVREPEVWLENRKKQREENKQVHLPLFVIFKRGNLANTLTACWWMASGFTVYYSIFALFATHLQKDLALSAALVSVPLMFSNAATFVASFIWGRVADTLGRRWAMIIPAVIALAITPTYLLTNDYMTLAIGFAVQGLFGGAIYGQNPSYLSERFPTEVRATAAGFCYHQGAIFGGLVAPVLTYIAVNYNVGFGVAMLIGTTVGLASFIIALLLGPETKGKELVSDIEVFAHEPGV